MSTKQKLGKSIERVWTLDSGHIRSIFEFFPPGPTFDVNLVSSARGLFDRLAVHTAVVFRYYEDSSQAVRQRTDFYFLRGGASDAAIVSSFLEAPLFKKVVDSDKQGACFIAGEFGSKLVAAFVGKRSEYGDHRDVAQESYVLLMMVDSEDRQHLEKFLADPIAPELTENPAPELYATIYMIFTAIGFRERLLSFFPPSFRMAFWSNIVGVGRSVHAPWTLTRAGASPAVSTGRVAFRPGHRTLSLSLDLRRSTFAMREAKDQMLYAYWMEALVEILRAIAHNNLGVFDKFTGDGVLVHFLGDHITQIMASDVAWSAVAGGGNTIGWLQELTKGGGTLGAILGLRCAQEMILAVNHHLENTKENLRVYSSDFGGAVGLAEDEAAWSMDNDGRPVIVGRGVVNACRLSDGKAGSIQLTNDLRMLLGAWRPDLGFEEIQLKTKDYPEGMNAIAWRIESDLPLIIRRPDEIRDLVKRVWLRVQRRSDSPIWFESTERRP